jgi:hypothetical protein
MPTPPVPGPTGAAHGPCDGGGDREPGSATAPARRKLIFWPESWRELARGSWSHRDLRLGTVAVPGFDGDWARLSDEIVRRSPRALVRSGLEAKLSHLKDLHARLAAVDLDAAQLAGEAAHDLIEALLRSLAAELRGSGVATPPRSPWPWWPTCRPPPPSAAWAPTGGCHRHAGRTALAAGRRDLALEVYAAANRPGLQQDCLARQCLALTSQPPPRRHLRAVQQAGRAGDAAAPWPARLSRSGRRPRAHLAPAPGGRPGSRRRRSGQTDTTVRPRPAEAGARRK